MRETCKLQGLSSKHSISDRVDSQCLQLQHSWSADEVANPTHIVSAMFYIANEYCSYGMVNIAKRGLIAV